MSIWERTHQLHSLSCAIPDSEEAAVCCYHAYLTVDTEREADTLKACLVGKMDDRRPEGAFLNAILRVVQSQLRQQSHPNVDASDLCFQALTVLLEVMQKRRDLLMQFDPKEIKDSTAFLKTLAERAHPLSLYLWSRLPLATRLRVQALDAHAPAPVEMHTQLTALLTACLTDPGVAQCCREMLREGKGPEAGTNARLEIEAALRGVQGVSFGRRLAHANRRLLGAFYPELLRAQGDQILFYARTTTRRLCIHAFQQEKRESPATLSLDAMLETEGPGLQIPAPDSDPLDRLLDRMTQERREVLGRERLTQVRDYFQALWQALTQRTPRQCAAVTLGLGASILRWWPPLGVAGLKQIAEQLQIEPYALAAALRQPRLNDLEIARMIGLCPSYAPDAPADQVRKQEKEAELKINSARAEAFEKLFECRDMLTDRLFLRTFYYALTGLQPALETLWDRAYAIFLLHHHFKRFSFLDLLLTQNILTLVQFHARPYLEGIERFQSQLPLPLEEIGSLVGSTPQEAENTYARVHKMVKTELKRIVHKLTLPAPERRATP